jgi:hypothetical protein
MASWPPSAAALDECRRNQSLRNPGASTLSSILARPGPHTHSAAGDVARLGEPRDDPQGYSILASRL